MSTTFLTNQNAASNFYMPRATATYATQKRTQTTQTSTAEGIDQGQLMVGIFCFLVPTMFTSAAFGLQYLLVEDLIQYGYYIAGAALAARIAMSIIIKGIAAEKNRSQSFWITLAFIVPALSLIIMSLVGSKSAPQVKHEKAITPAKPATYAREVYMPQRSKAM